jgi:hypothetical protein
MAKYLVLPLLGLATAVMAQNVRTERFHGRQAWVLENDQIRVGVLRGGGHIAEVRFRSGGERRTVNPMRVPHYQTIEPYEYDPARHDALYGSNSHRWLSSGYMGHLLCFPVFGPPSSPEEVRNGLGNHGEAPIVEWKPVGSDAPASSRETVFRYGADLRQTLYRVDRTLTLRHGEPVLLVEEWVESLVPFDRPVNWMQHATFGPPFIAAGKSYLDLSGTAGQVSQGAAATNSLRPGAEFRWPEGTGREGSAVSLRPFQPAPNAGTYFAVLMDRQQPLSFFTMYNPEFGVLIGYLFRTDESPWVGDFQENQRIQDKPWDGKTITRGIEFGTTPFAEGLRRSVERASMFGVPTYRWIAGRERAKMTYAIFLADIPAGFAGVAGVTLEGDAIEIQEQGTSRRIKLPAGGLVALRQ